MVDAVTMITSFITDDADGGNKNINDILKKIVSIHLTYCGNNCSNLDNDGSVVSFETTADDQRTNDDNDLSGTGTAPVNSELENDNSDENVVTGDDDDGNDNNNNNNNNTGDISGDNKDDNSKEKDLVPDNDHTISTTNPTKGGPY